MYWDAWRSIAQTQLMSRNPGSVSHLSITSDRLAREFRDHVHERLRLEIRIERQRAVWKMVGPGKHLIDPAVSVRQSPSEDRPEWRPRRDGAQDIADSFRNDRVSLRHGRRQLGIVDVKLGHDDIETPRAEFIDTLCKTVGVNLQFAMQVSLQANGMKGRTFVEQIGNEITQAGAPCSKTFADRLGIIIVQGKLNVRISIGGKAESHSNI